MKAHAKRKSLIGIAGLLTGAEAAVNYGVNLPIADVAPWWLRLLVIVGIIGGAYFIREKVDGNGA